MMDKKNRLLHLFSKETEAETRENPKKKNQEIRTLLKQVDIVDPAFIQRIKNLRPAKDDLLPLSTVALIPYINDRHSIALAWDLLMPMTKAALEFKLRILNPETRLPLATYAENGMHQVILDADSEPLSNENYIANWLVRFGDAVEWFKINSFPFAEKFDAMPPAITTAAPTSNLKGTCETQKCFETPRSNQNFTHKNTAQEEIDDTPDWKLKRPKRFPGYRKIVYDELKRAHAAKKPLPTPREIIEAFQERQPPGIIEVMDDGFKYYDGLGNSASATLKDIRKTINRLIE